MRIFFYRASVSCLIFVQITLSSMIDADWTIGRERADIAGKILADALLNREQVWHTGNRL